MAEPHDPQPGEGSVSPSTEAGGDVKTRRPDQTVCDEPAGDGKLCFGHLKIYWIAPKDVLERIPEGKQIFRCQRCYQLYEGEALRHLH